jgi:hypothetical protein
VMDYRSRSAECHCGFEFARTPFVKACGANSGRLSRGQPILLCCWRTQSCQRNSTDVWSQRPLLLPASTLPLELKNSAAGRRGSPVAPPNATNCATARGAARSASTPLVP